MIKTAQIREDMKNDDSEYVTLHKHWVAELLNELENKSAKLKELEEWQDGILVVYKTLVRGGSHIPAVCGTEIGESLKITLGKVAVCDEESE